MLLLYGAFVLHAVTILGVAHTAPFSPWSFGDYLSRMMPLLWLGMLFFLTFYTSPQARRAAILMDATPMPPKLYALARCAAAGEPMALLTACVPELCRAALARHRLEGYFRQIIFVQELGLEKRNPEAFTRSLALLEAEAGDCTLFEDSPGACRAAQAVGIRAVGVFDPFYASYEAEMRGFCDRYITSFTELL